MLDSSTVALNFSIFPPFKVSAGNFILSVAPRALGYFAAKFNYVFSSNCILLLILDGYCELLLLYSTALFAANSNPLFIFIGLATF